MGMLVNPYRHVVAGGGAPLDDLFASGEVGDYWRFDNVHTDQPTVGNRIASATGLVNGHVMLNSGLDATKPILQQPSGNYAAAFASDTLAYSFGSTISQPITIIMCVGDITDTSTAILCTGSSSALRCQISIDSSGNIIMFAGSTRDTTLNAPVSGAKVFTAHFNGASSYFRQNGTQTVAATAGTQGTNRLTLGQVWDGTFGINSGYIYSVLFINRALTTGAGNELDTAERQLGSDAGLTW